VEHLKEWIHRAKLEENPHRMPVPGTIVEEPVIDHFIGGKDVQIKMTQLAESQLLE
jgi:hypothetical protein